MRLNVWRMYCAAAHGSGLPFGPFRVHVYQAHMVGAERPLKLAVRVVALIVEPGRLGPPVRFVRLPDVRASEGETERLESPWTPGRSCPRR